MVYTQENRQVRIQTALGDDGLMLAGFTGHESVSEPFSFTVNLLSEDPAVDPNDVLRTAATITIKLSGGGERYLHGMINRFVQLAHSEGLTEYRAQFVPWLWYLSLSSDCRIYQHMTVLEIVEKVFKDQGYSDFKIECKGSYQKRDYCVQYRETHLGFVSRLLEEEGILYFFRHSDSKHEMVLVDENDAMQPCPVRSTAPVTPQGAPDDEVVMSVECEHTARVGAVTLRHYDYLQPSTLLESSIEGEGVEEIYDYPGIFTKPDAGDRLALLKLEEREAWFEVLRGESTCRYFQSGFSFDLTDHYRDNVNKTYKLLTVRHVARAQGYRAGESHPFEYGNEFTAIPKDVPYRPPRATPKPVVQGSQTALVVGASGSEIHVDEYGRVKVQFHWDRVGKKDDGSSCWVRVASTWAGKNWGLVQIPRVGQEVLVDFLEGDPDRPIITGRVYNAEQMPPYDLPANKTQSGMKTRSSPGGTPENFNEIRMEDKKGEEQLYIHAEKDEGVVVENNRSLSVGANESITVGNDRKEHVGNNEKVEIGNDRMEVIGRNEVHEVKLNRTESVGADETVTINGNRVLSTNGTETKTVNLAAAETIGLAKALSIGLGYQVSVGGAFNETVIGAKIEEVGAYRSEMVAGYNSIKVGKKLSFVVGDEVEIKNGQSVINMKKDGKIEVSGTDVTFKTAAGKINIDPGGIITIKGTMVKINT